MVICVHFYSTLWASEVLKGDMFCRVSMLQVDSVTKKEKAKQRPLALNTVEMLRVASSALGNRLCF